MNQFYHYLAIAALPLLAIALCFCLIRAIRGPRIADRIMGINMIGTLSLIAIAILSYLLEESWLLDVCLIYCMISFLAVVVLTKTYIADYKEEQKHG